jgi:hypothetical protein
VTNAVNDVSCLSDVRAFATCKSKITLNGTTLVYSTANQVDTFENLRWDNNITVIDLRQLPISTYG